MNRSINPYQPASPTSVVAMEGVSLPFHGTIEPSDYLALQPSRDFEWLLYFILAVLLSLCNVLFVTLLIVGVWKRESLVVLSCLLGCFIMTAGLWYVLRRAGRKGRAKRELKRYADVLGTAEGVFEASGLLFYDGVHHYWFSPSRLQTAVVTPSGIRFHVGGEKYHYLALTERLIDGYDFDLALRLKDEWTATAIQEKDNENPGSLELWQRISQPPVGAIVFKGSVKLQQSLRTPQTRRQAWLEVGTSLFLFMLAYFVPYFSSNGMMPWISYGLVGYAVFCLFASLLTWRRYFKGSLEQAWYQHGWLSGEEFATCDNLSGVKIPLSEFESIRSAASLVTLKMRSGIAYLIPRDQVPDPQQWDALKKIVALLSERKALRHDTE